MLFYFIHFPDFSHALSSPLAEYQRYMMPAKARHFLPRSDDAEPSSLASLLTYSRIISRILVNSSPILSD
jgi:hypothetical protein